MIKSNNVAAHAAFRSHTKRSVPTNKHFVTPAPGAYDLDDSAIRTLGRVHQSSFKSTSKRDAFGYQPGLKVSLSIVSDQRILLLSISVTWSC